MHLPNESILNGEPVIADKKSANYQREQTNGHAAKSSNEDLFISASSTTEFTSSMLVPKSSQKSIESGIATITADTIIGDNILTENDNLLSGVPTTSYCSCNGDKSCEFKHVKNESKEQLLEWKDMPKHLQFNPYVLTGYRPLQTIRGCFMSLFCFHNETINILTHGIPIFYILVFLPAEMPWEKEFRFLSFCHIFGAVAPWCGSFVYHLFMNLEYGESLYYRLLQIDMLGIWVTQSFGAIPMVTASVHCSNFPFRWTMILGYCKLSIWGLYKALSATSPWQRRFCFLLPFTMRALLTFLRTMQWVGGNPQALTHVYLQDIVSVIGGAIGAMNIPEKWWPGNFDLIFNSHNIMHVLVVVAVYSMHKATLYDFEWMKSTECGVASYNTTFESIKITNIEL